MKEVFVAKACQVKLSSRIGDLVIPIFDIVIGPFNPCHRSGCKGWRGETDRIKIFGIHPKDLIYRAIEATCPLETFS